MGCSSSSADAHIQESTEVPTSSKRPSSRSPSRSQLPTSPAASEKSVLPASRGSFRSQPSLSTTTASFTVSGSSSAYSKPTEKVKPIWSKQILSSGSDKEIFAGTYKGQKVAVCVAKKVHGGAARIQNEITIFKKLGSHPHIIEMHCSGVYQGSPYIALEIVEPIGYDLDRLKNMYAFARQVVPSSLMARIFTQLAGALGHMHEKGLIHRDLKTENVLYDAKHNAKLIDMGIACEAGQTDCLRAAYLAPELCEGLRPLDRKVDSWGLGLILHQVYQQNWAILTEAGPVKMEKGRPSDLHPMEKPVRAAMCSLLQFEVSDRWSLNELLACEWLTSSVSQESSGEWQEPAAGEDAERRYLRRHKSNRPMPTALGVFITRKNHRHLIGKPLSALQLSSGLGITVLLISSGKGQFESRPGADSSICENNWVYFGVPQGEGPRANAVAGLEAILSPPKDLALEEQPDQRKASKSGDFRALDKTEVFETGKLVEFTVEFDSFAFPGHIGEEAVLGAPVQAGGPPGADDAGKEQLPKRQLDLRRKFGLNLVGIQRIGDDDPEWFPRASAVVKPDDLGLVVRLPCHDGSTEPIWTDDDLEPLMNEELFGKVLQGELA